MGSVTSLSSGAMTISDASQWRVEMQARGMSPRTIVERLRIVDRISAHCGATATELTREDLLAYLARDMAPSSRATYWAALRAWSGWLQRTGRRTDDPTATLDAPRTPKCSPHPITTDQLMALLGSDMWQSTRAMVILAAWAGLRVHEIAKVRGEDVDGGSLLVVGKGGRTDRLPMHPEVAALAARMPKRGWWFPSPADSTRPVDRTSVSAGLSRAMHRAGIDASAHSLRHWFGTMLVRNGVDLRTAQQLLRHESLATTAIYVQVDDEQRRAGIARLPAMERPPGAA